MGRTEDFHRTALGIQKKKDGKRVSNEPEPELPTAKRQKPETEKTSLEVSQNGHTVSEDSRNETSCLASTLVCLATFSQTLGL